MNEIVQRMFMYAIKVRLHQAGLFPHLCLLSHSCDPNTWQFYIEDKVLVKANRFIKEGEDISISYVPETDDRIERQTTLADYFFTCQCDRCELKGGWKEKEAKVIGLTCPGCLADVACNDEAKFICPNRCWSHSREFSSSLLRYLDWKIHALSGEKGIIMENQLKIDEGLFPELHQGRLQIYFEIAKKYFRQGNEDKMREYLFKLQKMAKLFPSGEVITKICALCYRLRLGKAKKLHDEELQWMTYCGLSIDVARRYWNEAAEEVINQRMSTCEGIG